MRRDWRMFIVGLACGIVVWSGVAVATDSQQIAITYQPLKYFFDGTEKAPPEDQQGFIYNNRTFVSLRFASEALGKKVAYDPATFSIFVGRQESEPTEFWKAYRIIGDGTTQVQYFREGAQTVRGAEMKEAALITGKVLGPVTDPIVRERTSGVQIEYSVPEGATRLKGTIFIPVHYFGAPEDQKVGWVMIHTNDPSQPALYTGDITANTANINFDLDVQVAETVRVQIHLYAYHGLPLAEDLMASQLGVSNLRFE